MIEKDKQNNPEDGDLENSPIFGSGFYWDWQRILSLVVAGAYLAIGLIVSSGGPLGDIMGMTLIILMALILPLACIWFGDEMGGYAGSFGSISKLSPGAFIRIGGWVLLFLPVVRLIIIWWIDSGLRK